MIGTWKLNLEKSRYPAGAAPKSATRTHAEGAGGITTTVTGVSADGSAVSHQIAVYDKQ